jgi:hypothetical protein
MSHTKRICHAMIAFASTLALVACTEEIDNSGGAPTAGKEGSGAGESAPQPSNPDDDGSSANDGTEASSTSASGAGGGAAPGGGETNSSNAGSGSGSGSGSGGAGASEGGATSGSGGAGAADGGATSGSGGAAQTDLGPCTPAFEETSCVDQSALEYGLCLNVTEQPFGYCPASPPASSACPQTAAIGCCVIEDEDWTMISVYYENDYTGPSYVSQLQSACQAGGDTWHTL